MIKFFRRFREQLLLENKFSKYLLYAVGEIILVVIGILLALQINTWNEDRKEIREEFKILEEVKSNLETTLQNFISDTIYNANTIANYRLINQYIENDWSYNPAELDSAFSYVALFSSPYTVNTAYKTLQDRGLDIIKNRSLRDKIVTMYDVETISLLTDVDKAEWSLNDNVVSPFYAKHIKRLDEESLNLARPVDFEYLKKSDEFINILHMLIRERKKGLAYYHRAMISIENLIELIESELNLRM